MYIGDKNETNARRLRRAFTTFQTLITTTLTRFYKTLRINSDKMPRTRLTYINLEPECIWGIYVPIMT